MVGRSGSALIGLVVLVLVAVASGCGGSSSASSATTSSQAAQAHAEVCTARARIEHAVDDLTSLPVSVSSAAQFLQDIQVIQTNLKTLSNELPRLVGKTRSQVRAATDSFQQSISKLANSIGSASALSTAAPQIQAALNQLKSDYGKAFDQFAC